MRLCTLQAVVLSIAALATADPVAVIYDTDMDTDVDDVGALMILHACENLGEAKLLGVVHSAPNPDGVDCIRAINAWYGRPEIPVGFTDWKGPTASPHLEQYRKGQAHLKNKGRYYSPEIASAFRKAQGKTPPPAEPGPLLYRRLLANQPDGSVVICAVGQVPALAALLTTDADQYSPLSGRDLAAQKVRLLVMMARGDFPKGADTFNWKCHKPAAGKVIKDWPGAFAVMPHGQTILTGPRLLKEGTEENPCRRAYAIYTNNTSRSSWDLCAAWYAVKGDDSYFGKKAGYRLHFNPEEGTHYWEADPESKHLFIKRLRPDADVVAALEGLMVMPPKKGAHQE